MLRGKLIDPEWWIKLFCVLTMAGLVVIGAGVRLKSKAMVVVGLCLGAPLVLGGVVMFAAAVVCLLLERRRGRKARNE
ncbi:hypothetical protein [Sorangium sp. So ce341]|uniref:hypothetical protein n=1 Tax=Sorangium sp. So ce341 TaxID=3133302 RepID=UPI003F61147B